MKSHHIPAKTFRTLLRRWSRPTDENRAWESSTDSKY